MKSINILIYLAILAYASVTDYQRKIIPDRVPVLLIALAGMSYGWHQLLIHTILATFLSIPFLVVSVKTNKLGGGDIKYIFSNSIALGFRKGYFGLLAGLIIIITVYFFKWRKESQKNKAIPMAPFLSAGYGAILLFDLLIQ